MHYRAFTPNDYEAAYQLWVNTPGMGLNTTDDSREGVLRYLIETRQPALSQRMRTRVLARFSADTTDAGDSSIIWRCFQRRGELALERI